MTKKKEAESNWKIGHIYYISFPNAIKCVYLLLQINVNLSLTVFFNKCDSRTIQLNKVLQQFVAIFLKYTRQPFIPFHPVDYSEKENFPLRK